MQLIFQRFWTIWRIPQSETLWRIAELYFYLLLFFFLLIFQIDFEKFKRKKEERKEKKSAKEAERKEKNHIQWVTEIII